MTSSDTRSGDPTPEASRAQRTEPPPAAAGARAPAHSDDVDQLEQHAIATAHAAASQAQEALAGGDPAVADRAARVFERFSRAAASLRRAQAPAPQPPAQDEAEELLAQIERALEGGRTARRAEVAALRERGIDPREGWVWDEAASDWTWDPGGAMARGGASES